MKLVALFLLASLAASAQTMLAPDQVGYDQTYEYANGNPNGGTRIAADQAQRLCQSGQLSFARTPLFVVYYMLDSIAMMWRNSIWDVAGSSGCTVLSGTSDDGTTWVILAPLLVFGP